MTDCLIRSEVRVQRTLSGTYCKVRHQPMSTVNPDEHGVHEDG